MPSHNVVITARFEPVTYHTVTVNIVGSGTVTGTGTYGSGEYVFLGATANENWYFVGFYDGDTPIGTFFTMPNHNVTYTARFEYIPPIEE